MPNPFPFAICTLGLAWVVAQASPPPQAASSVPTIPGYRALNPAPSLDTLLVEGRRNSPLLLAFRQETAAEAMRSGADALPAPVLGAEVGTRTVGLAWQRAADKFRKGLLIASPSGKKPSHLSMRCAGFPIPRFCQEE